MKPDSSSGRGFTLIELVMVVVILGIVAAIALPRMGGITEEARITTTKEEMLLLKRAISGNSRVVAGDRYIDIGFEGDIGRPPDRLEDLASRPDSIAVYNKFTRIGWNGPYIDTIEGNYLLDSWGSPYIYDAATRAIKSIGGNDTIVITF